MSYGTPALNTFNGGEAHDSVFQDGNSWNHSVSAPVANMGAVHDTGPIGSQWIHHPQPAHSQSVQFENMIAAANPLPTGGSYAEQIINGSPCERNNSALVAYQDDDNNSEEDVKKFQHHGDSLFLPSDAGSHGQSYYEANHSMATANARSHIASRYHPVHPEPVRAPRTSRRPRSRVTRRPRPEDDPENHMIKDLRTKELLPWAKIVEVMNDYRRRHGRPTTFTDAAVYGRFTRNAPRIAYKEGDYNFDKNDWMYLKTSGNGRASRRQSTGSYPNTPVTVGDSSSPSPVDERVIAPHQERLLVDIFNQNMPRLWEVVAEQMNEETGGGFTPEECAQHFQSKL